jgi:hypothetical protein
LGNEKPFVDMTRQDIVSFLDSMRKPESLDPLHRWVGTYNLYRVLLVRFFKWLYYPDIEKDKRAKPSVIQNIPQLKRKEQSKEKLMCSKAKEEENGKESKESDYIQELEQKREEEEIKTTNQAF